MDVVMASLVWFSLLFSLIKKKEHCTEEKSECEK